MTPTPLLICNQQLQQTPVIALFSLQAILLIFQLAMLELSSSDYDSDTASASNFGDHNWKSVESTCTSPSDINFSEPSGLSNSVTLN